MKRSFLRSLLCAAAMAASTVHGADIIQDTRWSGRVDVTEDTRIAPGATLTIEEGAVVRFIHSESTKTEPQFWNPDTELAVEGRLVARGTPEKKIVFLSDAGLWGGLIVAPGGEANLVNVTISGADDAVLVKEGRLHLSQVEIQASATGLVAGPGADIEARGVAISGCEVGVLDLRGRDLPPLPEISVSKAKDAAWLRKNWTDQAYAPPAAKPSREAPVREFVGEYTVDGEERWLGTIIISGRVTVPPGSRLNIAPGTSILFRKRDTNGDGLGEGELLVLGSVRCLGTAEKPVIFTSAEEKPRPGDWDKVSIISSEDNENRFEHTNFSFGVQALHAHFSSFKAFDCQFTENLRALQFQESSNALVARSTFIGNKQALRFRDSTVTVADCVLTGNDYAIHAYRSTLTITGTSFKDTLLGGMLAKECNVKLKGDLFEGSRGAMKFRGAGSVLSLAGNKALRSVETALSLNEVEARLTENTFDGAGLDLVGIEGGSVTMRGNVLGASGRDAVHLNSKGTVDARCNDWSAKNPSLRIHDQADDPALGKVVFEGPCD